jgi:predicted secreted protein
MTWTTGLAIYFLIWWITLFAVLPFGIRSQHEAEYEPGTDPGAPILPRILSKLLWTTLVSALVFAILYVVYAYRLIGLDDIPGLPRPRSAS